MFLSSWRCTAQTDYEVHQHLHHLFDAKERVFLWRREGHDVRILSTIRPVQTVPCRSIGTEDVPAGKPMSFELRFVAARCVRRDGRLGAKVPLRGMRERRLWLADKLRDSGAELRFAEITDDAVTAKDGLIIKAAKATGVIVIVDRARFAARWQAGFGRNRAFGCGLLWMPEVCA